MEIVPTQRFLRSYQDAPIHVQKAFDKQARFLVLNLRHPSFHAKKYRSKDNLWQARVTGDWRFYFVIESDKYILIDMLRHL